MSETASKDTLKVFGGTVLSYLYNHWLSNFPSRTIRGWYLKGYLQQLGKQSGIQMGVRFLNGRKVSIGDNVVINWGCVLDGRKHAIQIGNNVSIGPDATVLTLGHDPRSPDFEDEGGAVVIEDRCWIAYRATVLPAVTMAEGSVLGAGSVLTKNTEPFGIYAGVPAVKVGDRPSDLSYNLNFNPWLT